MTEGVHRIPLLILLAISSCRPVQDERGSAPEAWSPPRTPSPSETADSLLSAPDSLGVLQAIMLGGADTAPRVLSMLREGEVPFPEYAALLLADSLVARGLGAPALEALGWTGDSLPPAARSDALVLRYEALLLEGRLPEATALRQSLPSRDSVLASRFHGALGLYRHERGLDDWRGALIQSIRLWPAGSIHRPAWLLLRDGMLSDPVEAESVADAFYAGGLWNELFDLASGMEAPPPRIVYLAARSRDRLGFYAEACGLLSTYLDRWPGGSDAESALMYLGLDLARAGLPDSGLAVLDRWEGLYPASPRRGNIPWYRGSILLENGRWADAVPHFERMLSEFPANVTADDSHLFLCLALLSTGRRADAAEALASMVSGRPTSVYAPCAAYLLGRLRWEEMNDPSGMDSLRAMTRLGRESMAARLALAALGTALPSPGVSSEPLDMWMRRNGIEPAPMVPAARRGAVLLAAGLRRWATGEFRAAEEAAGGAAGRFGPLYLQLGAWERMPTAGWRLSAAGDEPWPLDLWRLRYPAAWPEIVLPLCAEYGFDPLLAWAIMRQESMFDPSCYSPAGARGLIQMIPSTSEYVAIGQGWDDYSPDALFDPAVSLRYGICYLSGVAEEVDGPVQLLASYNGGPHNATGRWGAGTVPDDLFFCRITFDETRRYVEKVYANYEIYRMLYPGYAALVQQRFTRPLTISSAAGRSG